MLLNVSGRVCSMCVRGASPGTALHAIKASLSGTEYNKGDQSASQRPRAPAPWRGERLFPGAEVTPGLDLLTCARGNPKDAPPGRASWGLRRREAQPELVQARAPPARPADPRPAVQRPAHPPCTRRAQPWPQPPRRRSHHPAADSRVCGQPLPGRRRAPPQAPPPPRLHVVPGAPASRSAGRPTMNEPPADVRAFLQEHPSLRLEPGACKVRGAGRLAASRTPARPRGPLTARPSARR